MKLSIITINYNNASGLQKTMESVLNQTSGEFEYIVVDGDAPQPPKGGVKEDVEVLELFIKEKFNTVDGFTRCTWLSQSAEIGIEGGFYSEKDKGIYNAMNKGIQMAKGDYIQFLNSSDTLVADDVTEKMINELQNQEPRTRSKELKENSEELGVGILYGNMLKKVCGKVICDKGFSGRQPTFLDFYTGTLNHSPVYIKRSLFNDFGLYDETLKYVSDWKWYVQVILFGAVKPHYVDVDVVDFDMSGVSTTNWEKTLQEKRKEMEKLFPGVILKDYDDWAFGIDQLQRLKRHAWAYRSVYLLERMLFQMEKRKNKKSNSSIH